MKRNLKIILVLLFSIFTPLSFAQELTKEEKEIFELQDKRTTGENGNLLHFLHSIDSNIRQSAIYALANIADSTTVSELNFLLAGPFKDYPKKEEIKAAAFLFGQTQCEESKKMLDVMLKTESDTRQKIILLMPYVINSFGKIGDENNLNTLIELVSKETFSHVEIDRALAMSIGRFALRKIKNERAVEVLKQLANKTNDTITLRNIAFAFWRVGDKDLLENAKEEIYNLAESKDAQTRMWAINAVGKLQDELLLLYVLESFDSEKDWRVKVNMLNSFTNFNLDSINHLSKKIIDVLGGYKDNENENISIMRLNILGKLFAGKNFSDSNDVKEGLIEIINSDEYSWRIRSEAANSLSLIFEDKAKKDLLKAFSNTDDYDLKSGIVKAFGNFNNGLIYKEVRDSISADVQRYNLKNPNLTHDLIGSFELAKLYRGFVEMLSNLDERVDEENQNLIRLIFTEFSSSKDPLIVDVCVAALKDSLYSKYKSETSMVFGFDYKELESPKDDDVKFIFIDAFGEMKDSSAVSLLERELYSYDYDITKAAASALEKITGKKYDFSVRPVYDFDWNYIERLSQNKFVTVKTNKGDIKIELLPDVAPFTVMNFLKLSEKNYFDRTIFHRVVPNFVIQGGDPTGTGYGGPGYSIRSEFSPLTYETGMVGMASSGKDTEGSQFFITHSATPHLDGRYTIFGKVIDGMDVVDKIMIGDSIERVTY